jgi:hypothetical protein
MSHFVSQRLHSFIQLIAQNHITSTGKMLPLCQLVQIVHDAAERIWEHAPNLQQLTMNS